ncbi:MAG: glycosyltransferase family 2 protein [Patescibacteria group bacterium]|jgi:dolichol-phosphate mannosyltransferase|nr:glycosyltransferase family 2 protein [Patescibacteria group bacterium]
MENQKDLTIVLPTFNEKGNVGPILKGIKEAMKEKSVSFDVLFVDDSSDDTPEEINRQIENNQDMEISLIHRPKEERTGLATAFIEGFKKAQGKYICCLDSDLQHPPSTIPALYEKIIEENADLSVATRYTKGGSAEGLGSLKTFYGIYRRAASLGFKYFTQILFIPARKTSDPLGGFFLFKKSVLDDVDFSPKGFKILVEILMRANIGKTVEIPYTFLARENDDSKANLKQGLEFFKHLWHIFLTVPEAGRFAKFCIVGGSGVIVNIGILYFLVEFYGFNEHIAWAFAVILSILTNYILNNVFTYSDKKSPTRKESLRRVTLYYLINFFSIIFNWIVFAGLMHFGVYYIIAALFGILTATVINFLLVTKLVWRLQEGL